MKKSKKIAALFLVAIFLTATVGITTYKHICASEGVFTSVLVPTQHDCSSHTHKTKQESCCHEEKKDFDKKHCCQDEVKSYKVQSEYKTETQQGTKIYTSFFILPIKWLFSIITNSTEDYATNRKINSSFKLPPHLSGGIEYLQFLRTWRL